jgi:thiamine biosynthesis lipoprotein
MGSPCEIRLDGPGSRAQRQQLALQAEAEVARIEARYSRYRPDSVLAQINAAAGSGQTVAVDAEAASLLDFAASLHADSDGLFDITSGVLRRAWDFRAGLVPTDQALAALLPLVGWRQVQWQGQAIALPLAGMELDFGGFGKEYAADRAATLLQGLGQQHGYVNLGGDIRVLGPRVDGQAWQFGIQHPRQPGAVLASVAVAQGALATSGDYERYLVHQGVRYCHILDPRSGWPTHHWQSISVVAPACVAAGALTTVAMLQGPDGLAFLQAQGVAYLAVDEQGRSHSHAL